MKDTASSPIGERTTERIAPCRLVCSGVTFGPQAGPGIHLAIAFPHA